MSVRPRIAITTWRRHLATFVGERTLLYTLGDEYVRCVADAGGVPLLLPHLTDPQDVAHALDGVDGLLIAGGGDVDPSTYGADDAGSYDTDVRADVSECVTVRRAREVGLPTLAICRGMQITNVAFGGTLHQDITAPGTDHPPISSVPDEVLGMRHVIDLDDGSRLSEVLGTGERAVNTIHHQAVDRLAPGFRVVGRARDGIVEAVETDDDWPFLGVQWHPEKRDGADAALFEWLTRAAGGRERAGTFSDTPVGGSANAG